MKTMSRSNTTAKTGHLISYEKALVALEMNCADEEILSFLKWLSRNSPIHAMHFLHVLNPVEQYFGIGDNEEIAFHAWQGINRNRENQMREEIQSHLGNLRDTDWSFRVRQGDPFKELLDETDSRNPDLIVIGQNTQRHSHGILARKLARHTDCDILVIPDRTRADVKRILVPVDFSENSSRALERAVALARIHDGEILIFCAHAFSMPLMSWYTIQRTENQVRRMLKNDRIDALKAFIAKHVPQQEAMIEPTVIETDRPGIGGYLMRFAQGNDIDLIMMGSKGHSGIGRILLGSVTERVLTLTNDVPVMVFR